MVSLVLLSKISTNTQVTSFKARAGIHKQYWKLHSLRCISLDGLYINNIYFHRKTETQKKLPSLSIQILNNSLAYSSQVTPGTHAMNCNFAIEVLNTKQLLNTKTTSGFQHCCPLGEEKYWEHLMNLFCLQKLNCPSKVCLPQCDI